LKSEVGIRKAEKGKQGNSDFGMRNGEGGKGERQRLRKGKDRKVRKWEVGKMRIRERFETGSLENSISKRVEFLI
jgi:hypothetical protein